MVENDPDSRDTSARTDDAATPGSSASDISDFDAGFLVGILVGEGHFGGDGRQPQVTLRMHVDHEALFRWLMARFPESRLYGPYDHSGRRYYQWMARGAFLRQSTAAHPGRALDAGAGCPHVASIPADAKHVSLTRPGS